MNEDRLPTNNEDADAEGPRGKWFDQPFRDAKAIRPAIRAPHDDLEESYARLKARGEERRRLAGPRPAGYEKPLYGTQLYWEDHGKGWISADERERDCALYLTRRKRALETSHRYARKMKRRPKPETNEYVPEMSLRVDLDKNLTGSAGRVARFLLKEAYQKARSDRKLRITVSYIAQGLDLSVRHVRRLLAVLHRENYIKTDVMFNPPTGDRSARGMTKCLCITLLEALFPRHRWEKWAARAEEPGRTFWSHKESEDSYLYMDRALWAARTMSSVLRAWRRATRWGQDELEAPPLRKTVLAGG